MPIEPYYRPDLAHVHHVGFAGHAANCAPGILELLEPIRSRDGVVLEIGCGSGLLTKYLVDAGHRVIATDASPALLDIAREYVPGVDELRRLTLPDDPLPAADAIVSIGHVISYLDDESALRRALVAEAEAVRPGGLLAIDVCDLRWGESRRDAPNFGRYEDDWAIVTHYELPSPSRFIREMAIFTRTGDNTWRRDDERHENVLIDTATLPPLLAEHGLTATLGTSFGHETLPDGLMTIIAHRP
jgi:SAM-dependent methyltransferase